MNIAKVIQFPQQQASKPSTEARKSMYSDKFQQGYVMSSLLYRKEVYPFLSDAARNVYVELENRINGYNKESDFVSWTQLQGGEPEESRKMSLSTVKVGLAMLLANNVISIVATGKQGIKKYRLNEISLLGKTIIKPSEKESSKYFGNRSTTETEVLQKPKQNTSRTEAPTTSETEDTIDNLLDNLDINKKKNLSVDNLNSEVFSNSIEYQREDQELYTFRELANVYTIKSDFMTQAKKLNSELTDDLILADLKNFAQWTTTREKTTAQGWMNYWIYRIQKSSQPKTKTTAPTPKQPPVRKKMTDAQINMFSKKLCNHDDFASTYSNVGETQKQFEGRIALDLRDQNKVKAWSSYLHDVGFAGFLEEFA